MHAPVHHSMCSLHLQELTNRADTTAVMVHSSMTRGHFFPLVTLHACMGRRTTWMTWPFLSTMQHRWRICEINDSDDKSCTINYNMRFDICYLGTALQSQCSAPWWEMYQARIWNRMVSHCMCGSPYYIKMSWVINLNGLLMERAVWASNAAQKWLSSSQVSLWPPFSTEAHSFYSTQHTVSTKLQKHCQTRSNGDIKTSVCAVSI